MGAISENICKDQIVFLGKVVLSANANGKTDATNKVIRLSPTSFDLRLASRCICYGFNWVPRVSLECW